MITSRLAVLVAVTSAAFGSALLSGCSHGNGDNTPKGGPADATLGQQNVSGQAAAYQERMNHDPQLQRGGPMVGAAGQAAGQAAAMQARMAAQRQHP